MTSTETAAMAAALAADRNADLRQDCGAGRATVAMPYKVLHGASDVRVVKGIFMRLIRLRAPGALANLELAEEDRRYRRQRVWPYWVGSEITPATKRDIPGDKI